LRTGRNEKKGGAKNHGEEKKPAKNRWKDLCLFLWLAEGETGRTGGEACWGFALDQRKVRGGMIEGKDFLNGGSGQKKNGGAEHQRGYKTGWEQLTGQGRQGVIRKKRWFTNCN